MWNRVWRGASSELLREAEGAVVRLSGLGRGAVQRAAVPVGGGRQLNTLICGPPDAPPLVLVHGYAAGAGFWFRNLAALSRRNRVYAVDLMGFGRSTRAPLPPVRAAAEPTEAEMDAVEDYFVAPLEAWRREVGLGRVALVGHSFGGYVSSLYALRHPEALSRLVLVSPFGVPDAAWKPARPRADGGAARWLSDAVERSWESGVTPQGIVKSLGPAGRSAVEFFVSRRMARLPDKEREAMTEYTFQLWAAEAAGEYALHSLFRPMGYARRPLAYRLPALRVPTTFQYGDHDWMDWRAAHRVVQDAGPAHPAFGPDAVSLVRGAGHNLFLDNPAGFERDLLATLEAADWLGPAEPAARGAALEAALQ